MIHIDRIVIPVATILVAGFLSCGCGGEGFDVANPLGPSSATDSTTDEDPGGDTFVAPADAGEDGVIQDDTDVIEDSRRGVIPDTGENEDVGSTTDSAPVQDSGSVVVTDSGVSTDSTPTTDSGLSDTGTPSDACVQHVHHDGVGGTFLDCAPIGAWSFDLATKAAKNARPTWTILQISGGIGCSTSTGIMAYDASCGGCYKTGCQTVRWLIDDPFAGRVFVQTNGSGPSWCACADSSTCTGPCPSNGWD